MLNKIQSLGEQGLSQISSVNSLEELEQARLHWLGKKGAFSEVLKGLGSVSADERPKMGAAANEWKAKIETALEARKSTFENAALEERLRTERIDPSLPARALHKGSLHPVTQTTRKIVDILARLGFDVTTGPEIETEFLNFEAVNIPKDHPARDMQDTFFMGPGVVLRTHTSAVQMRALRSRPWPVRILCPGAVYRCDNDATHLPMFHQVEGLWVDRKVRMSDLKGTLEFLAKELFGNETKIRLRPSYFPFVEPGAEVDVSCFQCRTKPSDSCRICKGSGWLEVLGAGMVHPRLFEMAGVSPQGELSVSPQGELSYDPKEVQGFAFGLGVERIAMLLNRIPDLRLMVQGDVRFLSQF